MTLQIYDKIGIMPELKRGVGRPAKGELKKRRVHAYVPPEIARWFLSIPASERAAMIERAYQRRKKAA